MDNGRRTIPRRPRHDAIALVLAGGNGTRLRGLAHWHAKPAVPFAGQYRTIDFTLSNCVNSGLRRIALLTQYKSQTLIRHIQRGWSFLSSELRESIEIWPAQQRYGAHWYAGTADAVHQNRDLVAMWAPEHVVILAGDHIYAMDYTRMLDEHIDGRADVTVGCVEVPLAEAHAYGVVEADRDARVRSFVEKPSRPAPTPGRPSITLASMGIYVFRRDFLFECVAEDAEDCASRHDFGYSVLPAAIGRAKVLAHTFRRAGDSSPAYWRDVGTIDNYWLAHMELLEQPPKIDLAADEWPIRTDRSCAGPAQVGASLKTAESILSPGCRVAGEIVRSVISTNCSVGAHSRVRNSVLLPNATVGKGCSLDGVIVDSGCTVPDNTVLGGSLLDADAGYYRSPRGILLVSDNDEAPVPDPQASAANRKVA